VRRDQWFKSTIFTKQRKVYDGCAYKFNQILGKVWIGGVTMKKLASRFIIILLVIALLGLPCGQGAQARVGNYNEVERARTLVLTSKDFLELQKLSLRDGLCIDPARQPLAFWGEEKGKQVYIASKDKHAIVFQEVDGHRVYQIFLGMQTSPECQKGPAGKGSSKEGSFIFAIVDMTFEQVLIVSRIDVSNVEADTQTMVWRDANGRFLTLEASAKEEDGKQIVVLQNPSTDWQAKYMVKEDGTITKVNKSGAILPLGIGDDYRLSRPTNGEGVEINPLPSPLASSPAVSCGWICSVVCGLVPVVVCTAIGFICPVCGVVCAVIFVFVCANVCEYVCQ